MRRFWPLVLFAATFIVAFTLTGCFTTSDSNPATAGQPTLNSLPVANGVMGGSTVRFSLNLGANLHTNIRPTIRFATDTPTASGTIATTGPRVTFTLVTINGFSAVSQTTSASVTVKVNSDGSAEAVFTNMPPRPTLAYVHFIDAWLEASVSARIYDLRGCDDLVPGDNMIAVQPTNSRFRRDVVANTVEAVVASAALFAKAPSQLTNAVEAAISYMDRGVRDVLTTAYPVGAYQTAIDLVAQLFLRSWNVTVNISSPTADFAFTAPASITVVANVTDASSTLDHLDFFFNNSRVSSLQDSQTPYWATVASVGPGLYAVEVLAYDKGGMLVASAQVKIRVNNPIVLPPAPEIVIVNPTDNATFTVGANGANIDINLTASDTLKQIAKIEFYQGTDKIGENSMAPCAMTWLNVPVGSYTLSARAIDRLGSYIATAANVRISVNPPPVWNGTAFYTTNADFEQGVTVGLEHTSVPDQLQLSSVSTTLPFIWIPNSSEGTISKVDTRTGKELGRYRTARQTNSSPSRTTVDLQGNCWVGNRGTSTVVKVGLEENGPGLGWVDRNHNNVCDTSRDTNNNGIIDADEIKAWGEDECVLIETVLIPDTRLGTYVPGQYNDPYSNDDWNPGPRGIAIDGNNNVWAGTYGTQKYYYINGQTGAILNGTGLDVRTFGNHAAYGAVVDRNGVVWSAGQDRRNVLRIDPHTTPPTCSVVDCGHFVYGIGLDRNNHVIVTGWSDSKMSMIDINTGLKLWTKDSTYCQRGVCCTDDNDIWTADSGPGTVSRWSNDGIKKATIQVGGEPTGVSVDADRNIWVICLDNHIKKIDPNTNQVILDKVVGAYHYGYSDMTGIVCRTSTTRLGTWSAIRDTANTTSVWNGDQVTWNGVLRGGAMVKVRVRSSVDQTTWAPWESVATSAPTLTATPPGRYLQIEATLQYSGGSDYPTVTDITVAP